MKRNNQLNNQSGQVLIALVLTLLTILTIGLIVIQRSTTDISTSTQNDQASRAFSAAEAGIEQALQSGTIPSSATPLSNDSSYILSESARLPLPRQAFEYIPTTRGETAQVWLANLDDPSLSAFYKREQVYVYFGDPDAPSSEAPAIEINLVTRNNTTGEYLSQRWYYDTITRDNGFVRCGSDTFSFENPAPINTSLSTDGTVSNDRRFKCRVRLNTFASSNITPIMIRSRILYSDKHPFAVAPIPDADPSTDGDNLPPQAKIYTSIGLSGQSRKTIQVQKVEKLVPFFFDYAVFSTSDIIKTN